MDLIKNLTKNKILALGASTFIIFVIGFILLYSMSQSSLVPLYNSMSPDDSYPITLRLKSAGVRYEVSSDGSQIMVPLDRVLSLRMMLAQEGLPHAKPQSGYEIFDKSDFLGASQFVNNINLTRAMEGEISRTINSLSPIESSRVHIVLPKRDLFSKTGPAPSASVMLKVRQGHKLSRKDISGIAHLLATAVPDLSVKNITIIDQNGRSMKADQGDEDEAKNDASKEMLDYRLQVESRIQESIEDLLSKHVGPGKVKASVTATINFNKEVINSEDFNPDRQVIRSRKSSNEEDSEKTPQSNVSVANNLPNYNQNLNGETDPGKKHSRSDDITNFEISKVVSNKVMQWGNIDRISVAVLIDGSYEKDEASSKITYKERTAEEIKKIRSLVASAAGIDEARGDMLEIINLPFERGDDDTLFDTPEFAINDKKTLAKVILITVALLVLAGIGFRPWILKLIRSRWQNAAAISQDGIGDDSQAYNRYNLYNTPATIATNHAATTSGQRSNHNGGVNSSHNPNNPNNNQEVISIKMNDSNDNSTKAPKQILMPKMGNGKLGDLVSYLNQSVKNNQTTSINAIVWLLNNSNGKK